MGCIDLGVVMERHSDFTDLHRPDGIYCPKDLDTLKAMTSTPVEVLVVIPARGGSKGIPNKNLQTVAGRSLIERAVTSALAAVTVDAVVVSTDSTAIADLARRAGATIVTRPDDLAGDQATSESAVIHALDVFTADHAAPSVVVMLQATSPFVDPTALDAAIKRVRDGNHDVVFSATQTHAFHWKRQGNQVIAVDHDSSFRPRRQDREPQYRETGAFYVMDAVGLRESGFRFFGRIGMEVVPEETAMEIDTLWDLKLARTLTSQIQPQLFSGVDALVTDFDGVHTDNRAAVDDQGHEFARVHRGDGLGVRLLKEAGIPVLILSTEANGAVKARADKLGVDVEHGVADKGTAIVSWIVLNGLDPQRVAYVGNDINDLPAFQQVGWPVAVADAHPEVLAQARLILRANGGQGAVREIADLILQQRIASKSDNHTD